VIQIADLPNRRVEAWKYSDLRSAAQNLDGWDVTPRWHKFIQVADEAHSVSPDIAGEGIVAQLVRATSDAGTARYSIPAGESAELVFEWEAFAGIGGHAVDIAVGEGATLRLKEGMSGEAGALGAVQLTLRVAAGGAVTRTLIQHSSGGTVLVSGAQVLLGAQAAYAQFALAEGAELARIETHVTAEGEGASVELNGIYMCAAGRHADLTSTITHSAPGGQTRQLIKGVAVKGGRGVFQGKIVVERAAQQTDARQHHQGMLLEAGAEIFAKPELMIFADDVQCAHGNTAGGLDEAAKFYLRSRGVPEHQARAMLIEAFLAGALPDGLPEELEAELRTRIGAWLEARP
jgi:Fe-S cluster assembly protein SufD